MDIRMKMLRYFLALLSIGTAFAQQPSTDSTPQTLSNKKMDTFFNIEQPTFPNFTVTAGASYQQGLGVGPNACGSLPGTINYGVVCVGVSAGASITANGTEAALGGAFTGQFMTTAYGVAAWGEHNVGFDNSNYITCEGVDCMRDTVGNTNSTAQGAQSQDDGVGNNNTSQGAFALQGNAGSIVLSGSKTTADALCIPFTTTNANVTALPASACYTVLAGDTISTIATGLATAINNLGVTYNLPSGHTTFTDNGVQMAAGVSLASAQTVIYLHFPGGTTTGWAITPGTPTCTGTCTEVLTVGAPFSGHNNLATGVKALYGAALAAANSNDARGFQSLFNLAGSSSGVLCYGDDCGENALSGSNSIIMGVNGAINASVLTDDVIITSDANAGLTSGVNETILNGKSSCVSTQNGYLEVGYQACVPTGSANYSASIQNGLYIIGSNTGGGGSSAGQLFFGTTTAATLGAPIPGTPGTTFTVSGCGVAGSVTGGPTAGTFICGTGGSTVTLIFTIGGSAQALHGWVPNVDDVTSGLHCPATGSFATGIANAKCTLITTSDLISFSAVPF